MRTIPSTTFPFNIMLCIGDFKAASSLPAGSEAYVTNELPSKPYVIPVSHLLINAATASIDQTLLLAKTTGTKNAFVKCVAQQDQIWHLTVIMTTNWNFQIWKHSLYWTCGSALSDKYPCYVFLASNACKLSYALKFMAKLVKAINLSEDVHWIKLLKILFASSSLFKAFIWCVCITTWSSIQLATPPDNVQFLSRQNWTTHAQANAFGSAL